ncbi:MAG: urea transporter [Planctomycetota bacterium]|jgi:murein DD-endopeptidase MepM/ murein hydrolase activator NlpD
MKTMAKRISTGLSSLFVHSHSLAGSVIALLFCLNFSLGTGALLCLAGGLFTEKLLKLMKKHPAQNALIYNPCLVGLALASQYEFDIRLLVMLPACGTLTTILTVSIHNYFAKHLLPVLSLPFSILVITLSILARKYPFLTPLTNGSLFHEDFISLYLENMPAASCFFKSLSNILFLNNVSVGTIIFILILLKSRIAAALACWGYFCGISAEIFITAQTSNTLGFNYILTSMMIGGVVLIPSPKSWLISGIASAVSSLSAVIIQLLLLPYSAVPLALPFCIATLLIIMSLRSSPFSFFQNNIFSSPEDAVLQQSVSSRRFPHRLPAVNLPVAGNWKVWQGNNGKWTHKGDWFYAYDFVICDEKEQSHHGEGSRLTDYYCYGKTVIAPARGKITAVIDGIEDNLPGTVNRSNHWGNTVMIQFENGLSAVLAHLQPHTIRVISGQWVETGSLIGYCGNSGHSPQPHLHIQLQTSGILGEKSVPFGFTNCEVNGEYSSFTQPQTGADVFALPVTNSISKGLDYLLDEELVFASYDCKTEIREVINFKIGMAEDGTYQMESEKGCLYFGTLYGSFVIYKVTGKDKWLKMLAAALPRIPAGYKAGLKWKEYVPADLISSPALRPWIGLTASFFPNQAVVEAEQTFANSTCIKTKFLNSEKSAAIEFDKYLGIKKVTMGDKSLKLKYRSTGKNTPEIKLTGQQFLYVS